MSEDYRHIVRIAGRDIDGQENLLQGLTRISGVGLRLSKAVLTKVGFDPHGRLGYLTDAGPGYSTAVFNICCNSFSSFGAITTILGK